MIKLGKLHDIHDAINYSKFQEYRNLSFRFLGARKSLVFPLESDVVHSACSTAPRATMLVLDYFGPLSLAPHSSWTSELAVNAQNIIARQRQSTKLFRKVVI
jgi:hypothetical protein